MKGLACALLVALVTTACSGDPAATPPPQAPDPGTGATTGQSNAPSSDATNGEGITCWSSPPQSGNGPPAWVDATEAWGLVDPLTGMHVHAGAWGNVNGDLAPDLFVGTFATARGDVYQVRGAAGPAPDRLLVGSDGTFSSDDGLPEMFGRTSGAVFADLDGDGDDDLVLSRNARSRDGSSAVTEVLENGNGAFSAAEAGLDPTLGGRSIGVLDVDEDGLLDLVIVVDRYRGGSSRVYRNLGELRFEDANAAFDLPEDVHGLGIATGDLNNDRHTDMFVAGSNRLFTGTGTGFVEVESAALQWEQYGPEDDVAGAAMADVNRDGWIDLLVGHHYNSTLSQNRSVPVRLYLNRTSAAGAEPVFEDVTEQAGLIGLPTKAPHVELADIDNDGWPDILTSASADSGAAPAVLMHRGLDGGLPRFATPDRLGSPQYWVGAPTADIDRDGRLDVLLLEWEPALPSLLLLNDSVSGSWLEVSVDESLGGGIGTRVEVFAAGSAGDAAGLLGSRDIVASLGYTTGVERIAHFGLGEADSVDVVVTPPPPHEPITLPNVTANQHIRLPAGCG